MFRLSRIDGRRRGVALVIVLSFLLLITVMIVAFFSSVTTELGSAKSYANGVSAKQLGDSAVNLVMGTIGTATSTGGSNAWASQPGMIRTYDSNGNPLTYYKLYSSDNMVLSSTDIVTNDGSYGEPFNFTHDLRTAADSGTQLTRWANEPAIFTDLNAPIVSGTTTLYPIVDPAALPTVTSGTIVEGFSASAAGDPGSPVVSGSGNNVNRLPMPVKWIYMLKNGALTAPDGYSNGGNTATWSSNVAAALTPTATNPIVGRIAFWTDDETCKVNINTASEGSYWGSPMTSSQEDVQTMAFRIPVQNEWQRTPGHPATTCLSTVLGSITNLHRTYPLPAGAPPTYAPFSRYYSLVPRISDAGGSTQAGTVVGSGTVTLDSDRLYASVDELLFSPSSSGGLRQLNPPGSGIITPDIVEQSKFFLTASSRAPEVNMFNRPRICLWPLQVSPDPNSPNLVTRNAQDNLIAFCSTTGTGSNAHPYYFQRMTVLPGGTINPGLQGSGVPASGAGSSQHPTLDFTANGLNAAAKAAATRNNQLYTYLQNLTGGIGPTGQPTGIPGFSSGTFLTKYPSPNINLYPSDRDQILTEMVDYIRCYLNPYNQALGQSYNYLPPNQKPYFGSAQAIPLEISSVTNTGTGGVVTTGTTKGFGNYLTVTGAALDFVKTSSTSMQAFVLLEFYNPAQGQPCLNPYTRVEIAGLDNLAYSNGAGSPVSLGFQGQSTARLMNSAYLGKDGGGGAGSMVGLSGLTEYGDSGSFGATKRTLATGNDLEDYPFYSRNVSLPNGSWQLTTTGTNNTKGAITIRIYSGFDPNATPNQPLDPQWLVQTINMNFLPPPNPSLTLPAPSNAPTSIGGSLFSNNGTGPSLVSGTGYVLRGMISGTAAGGDLRMMAALPNVPASFFSYPPNYSVSGTNTAYSLRTNTSLGGNVAYLSNSNPGAGSTFLVPGVSYPQNAEPTAGHGLAAALLSGSNGKAPGDWDNGYGAYEDGAYINKADAMNALSVEKSGTSDYYYISNYAYDTGLSYSPNRQISSAVSFGSLPTGVIATEAALAGGNSTAHPWQTLLFCPNPAAGGFNSGNPNHPGFGRPAQNSFSFYNPSGTNNMPPYKTPPDHLMLDLFTMPIVQPYPISEPFSTAGKINLNYQIAPFSYITRSTGIQAVLKSVKVMAIPSTASAVNNYKANPAGLTGVGGPYRYDLNLSSSTGTLQGFEQRFGTNDIFHSASEICDIYLVPYGGPTATYNSMDAWWKANGILSGDNTREAPYGQIYARVTTKSNSYLIHVRAQALRQIPAGRGTSDWAQWNEGRDQIVGEYRGSSLVERYVDPGDSKLPDFATLALSDTNGVIDNYYKFRIISTKKL